MHVRFHPPNQKRVGHLEALAVSILAAIVMAAAGVPSIAAVAASDPSPSPAPSASPSASPAPSPSSAPGPSPTPGPSATASSTASPTQSPDPTASASPDASAPASPGPSAVAALQAAVATPTPPPGAIAAFALKDQPYRLPTFVGLGTWQVSSVSFYGPGFYCVLNRVKDCLPQRGGSAWPNGTACGVMYTRTLVGVANRTLPCGTLVAFSYRGRTVIAPVVDRGPYVTGRDWDLSGGLCSALRHCFTGPIRWTIVHRAIGPALPLRISLRYL